MALDLALTFSQWATTMMATDATDAALPPKGKDSKDRSDENPIESCWMGITKKTCSTYSTIRSKCLMRKYRGFAYSQILGPCESFDSQSDGAQTL